MSLSKVTVAPAGPIPKCPVTLAITGSACLSSAGSHPSFLVPQEPMSCRPVVPKYIWKCESRGRGKVGKTPPRSDAEEASHLFPVDMWGHHGAYKPFGAPARIPHGHLWVGLKPQGPAAQSWACWKVSVTGLFLILVLQSTRVWNHSSVGRSSPKVQPEASRIKQHALPEQLGRRTSPRASCSQHRRGA